MKHLSVALLICLIGCSATTQPLTPASIQNEATDIQRWKIASAQIRQMLADTGRTEKEIEQPKWFESEYSTLGRMPLIDTALAQPLLMPEIALYFDDQCQKNGDNLSQLFNIAGQMADQVIHGTDICQIKERALSPEALALINDLGKNNDLAPLNNLLALTIASVSTANAMRNRAFSQLSPDQTARMTHLLSQYYLKEKDGQVVFSGYTVDSTDDNVELLNLMQKVSWDQFLHVPHNIIDPATVKEILKRTDLNSLNGQPDILFDKQTSFGRIIVGNIGNNIYTEDAAIIIDLGGDDQYLNNAGGTRPGKINCAIVIDVSGNDIYKGEDFCQGSGYMGVGVLMDLAGDDTYIARNFSQASALGGFGMLYDAAGNDTYTGDFGCQSAAIFGYSILSDRAGNDSYKCSMLGQAGASTLGVAILSEGAGNDTYQGGGKYPFYGTNDSSVVQGAAIGIRPWPAQNRFTLYGGIALLSDASGDDRYSAQAFAQGGSYILSLGMMVDSMGNDVYSGTDYVQGSACHLGAAVMVDRTGNDAYSATNHSTGGSLDRSAGVFMDIQGNDTYNSPEGVGYAGKPRGCGIFVDCAGDDRYEKGVLGRARYPYSENTQSNTFFLDMAGSDTYSATYCANNKSWQQGQWGMARDWESEPVTSSNPIWAPMTPQIKPPDAPTFDGKLQEIMAQVESTSTLVRFEALNNIIFMTDHYTFGNTINHIACFGAPFLRNDLIDMIEAARLKKVITKENVLQGPGRINLQGLVTSDNENVQLAAIMFFIRTSFGQGELKEDIIERLVDVVQVDKSADVRSIAVMALGKTGDVNLLPIIEKALQDKEWSVRRRAVMALGYIKDKKSLDILINLLSTEKAYQVRPQIVSVIGRLGFAEAIPYLKNVAGENEFVRYYAARSLAGNFKDKTGIDALIGLIDLENLAITDEILGILKELTKQDFAKDKAKWQQWWNGNKVDFKY